MLYQEQQSYKSVSPASPSSCSHQLLIMGGKKRTRSGRQRANETNPANPRQKEEAELLRITKAAAAIPSYSNRFQLFRQNRRQKARQNAHQDSSQLSEDNLQPLAFRATRFSELPLSTRTLDGLAASGFSELTTIQRNAIPQALAGRDVLAAAQTGSGKTLAFLIPLLETLWRKKWNTMDGLGALILSPTRELSLQIFEVLRSVARMHMISAGLIIGGKDFEGERDKVGDMNVLVATPGRMLHHMDHVAELDCSNLQVLVLDEADRILDMGFAKTLDAILANLPKERQTLLFSATQTKSIKALARLSLSSPEYVAVASHESREENEHELNEEEEDRKQQSGDAGSASIKIVGTPKGLSQSYAVVPAHEKLSVLWSFIKTHLKSKMIVFMSSGKQVRFVFETFCKLRPGMSLLHLHGNMKQLKRTDVYDLFCRTKSAALFATDVASRGLDFPDVEWVIQLDCPDDVGTYVHRVGRTARFRSHGRAMLLLREGKEETFLEKLKRKKLELHRTKINQSRVTSIQPKIAAAVASSQELRKLAQRAFLFYVKSVFLQHDKDVFDVKEFDFGLLAKSYGLSVTPNISFKSSGYDDGKTARSKGPKKSVFGYRVLTEQKKKENIGCVGDGREGKQLAVADDDQTGDILELKSVYDFTADNGGDLDNEGEVANEDRVEKRKKKKRKLDLLKGMPSANRIVFTEDGTSMRARDIVSDDDDNSKDEVGHKGISDYAATVSRRLALVAGEDKDRERERVKSIHSRQRAKRRELNKIIRPSADALQRMVSGASDNDESQDSESSADDSSSDSEKGEHKPSKITDDEQLALQILQSRR